MRSLGLTISTFLIALATTVLPQPPPPPIRPSPCPPGSVFLPDSFSCYHLIPDAVPWHVAKQYCPRLGLNSALAIIDNGPELELIASLVNGGEVWVGDEISTYPYPPQCVKAVLAGGAQRLIAVPCDALLPYVCEIDISPNPCKPYAPNVPTALTYYPHPALPYKFIQCDLVGRPYVKLCAKGTIWNQALLVCIAPPPPPPPPYPLRRKRSNYPKRPRGRGRREISELDHLYDEGLDEYEISRFKRSTRPKHHRKPGRGRGRRDIYGQGYAYDEGLDDYEIPPRPIKRYKPKKHRKYDEPKPYRPEVRDYYKPIPDTYYKSPFYRTLYTIEVPKYPDNEPIGYDNGNYDDVYNNDDGYQNELYYMASYPKPPKNYRKNKAQYKPLPTPYKALPTYDSIKVTPKHYFPTDGPAPTSPPLPTYESTHKHYPTDGPAPTSPEATTVTTPTSPPGPQ